MVTIGVFPHGNYPRSLVHGISMDLMHEFGQDWLSGID
jgi:hypothetical protein